MARRTVSWCDLRFTVYDSITVNWREVGAVYIFVRHYLGTWKMLYVGQTENLKERLPKHEKRKAALGLGFNQIHVFLENSEKARLAMESRLIKRYRPPLNQRQGG